MKYIMLLLSALMGIVLSSAVSVLFLAIYCAVQRVSR